MSNSQSKSIQNVIEKNKVLVSLMLIGLIILGVVVSNVFSMLAFLLFCVIVVVCDEKFLVCMMLFLLPYASMFKLAPNVFSLYTVCEILALIKVLLKHKIKVSVIVMATAYFVYLALGMILRGMNDYVEVLKQVEGVLLLSILVSIGKEIKFEKIAVFYILGIVTSSVFGMVVQNSATFLAYAKEIYMDAVGYSRFCGLRGDPNYYSIDVIVAILLLLALRKRGTVSKDVFWVLFAVLSAFGVLTLSKSFILIYIIVFIASSIIVFQEKNPIEMILLVAALFVVLMVGFSSDGPLSQVLERIRNADDMYSLTSGRSKIWEDYLAFLGSDAGALIFGSGITCGTLNGRGTHNFFLESLYYLGIIGTLVLLGCFIVALKGSSEKIKRTSYNWFAWVVLLIMYFFLQMLLTYDLMFQIFLIYTIWTTDLRNQKKIEQEQVQE